MAGWFDEIESLSDDEEEGDGYDKHVTVNGLHVELCEEAAGDASGTVLEISLQSQYCETADGAAEVNSKL